MAAAPAHTRDMGERERKIYRVTLLGSIINLLLLLFKFFAGIAGRSSAMIADAVHSLSDFATDLVVLVFVHIGSKPHDKSHDYGHGKFETLATAIIAVSLFFVGVGIFVDGARKIYAAIGGAVLPAPHRIALWAALLSIAAKEAAYRITARVGRSCNSRVVMANAWHHRSDALSSVGTAAGIGGAIFLGEGWRVLDPVAAIVVSVFIVKVSLSLIRPSIDELLEKSLPDEVEDEIRRIAAGVPGAQSPHHLCTRRIGSNYAIEMHILMPDDTPLSEAHRTATDIENRLRRRFGIGTHITLHVEPSTAGEEEEEYSK